MTFDKKNYDALIIGGGIFGLYTANYLSSKGLKVALLEKEKALLNKASKVNQARVHNGYHYPRSLETAKLTSCYYDRFCKDFNLALIKPFKQYYAISKENSRISVDDYIKFCKGLNLPLKEINSSLLFKKNKIAATFEVEESCFNYVKIKDYFINKITNKVDIYYQSYPISIDEVVSKYLLTLNIPTIKISTPIVINATYSMVNEVNNLFSFSNYEIKYELCELAIGTINSEFSNIGLTVIDGPFFSLIPYGENNKVSLSSVDFSPINTSYLRPQDKNNHILKNAKNKLLEKHINWKKMERLAETYLKQNINFTYNTSIFEIKPILTSSEENDDRPTLITIHSRKPFFISVLSGKISTIYDLDQKLNTIF